MPFDGLSIASRSSTLAQAAANLGITGVDAAVLEAHKANEVAKHQSNFAYRHHGGLVLCGEALTVIGMAGSLLAGCIVVFSIPFSMPCSFLVLLGLATGSLLLMFIPVSLMQRTIVRGPAYWVEQPITCVGRMVMDRASRPRQTPLIDQPKMGISLPGPVRRLAGAVRMELETMGAWHNQYSFIYGELRQDETILDPYLVLRNPKTGEQLILAIWIDDTILHMAAGADITN